MRFAGPGRRYRVERSADGRQRFPFNTGEEIPGHGTRWSALIPKPLLPLERWSSIGCGCILSNLGMIGPAPTGAQLRSS
jgi:hypothetical protein